VPLPLPLLLLVPEPPKIDVAHVYAWLKTALFVLVVETAEISQKPQRSAVGLGYWARPFALDMSERDVVHVFPFAQAAAELIGVRDMGCACPFCCAVAARRRI
jgi:hypothetical protein